MNQQKKEKWLVVVVAALLVIAGNMVTVGKVFAGTISSYNLTESTYAPGVTSTHTNIFYPATAGTLEEIKFQYGTTSGGTTIPTHLDLTSATLGTIAGLSGTWTIDLTNATSGVIVISNASGSSVTTSTQITVPFQNITNAHVGDCTGGATYYDTCFVRVTTYSDLGITSVDQGDTNYQLVTDASISVEVDGVNSGTSTNGITTTQTSTPTSIPFGHLLMGDIGYVAQKITVITNASNGYSVYMQVKNQIQGAFTLSYISPFNASGVSWSTPVVWSAPTGTTSGTDTGWIGANTSDTRVSGWSSASAKFGPANSTANTVMYDSGPDTGTSVYVTYGFSVNAFQYPDNYSGTIVYTVVPNY